MTKVYYPLLLLLVLTVGCSSSTVLEEPPWVWKLIAQYQLQPVGNPPLSIWRYEFEGRTVYYVPAHCCDIPAELYDAEGNYLCAPNGGFDGQGDGNCPNFLAGRTNERLVWKDARAR